MKDYQCYPGNSSHIGWPGVIRVAGYRYQLSIDNGSTWNLINTGNANRSINGFLGLGDGTILGYGFGESSERKIRAIPGHSKLHHPRQSLITGTGINVYSYTSATISKSTDQGITLNAMALTGICRHRTRSESCSGRIRQPVHQSYELHNKALRSCGRWLVQGWPPPR